MEEESEDSAEKPADAKSCEEDPVNSNEGETVENADGENTQEKADGENTQENAEKTQDDDESESN